MRILPILSLLAAASLSAQVSAPADPLESLVRDSPFLPAPGTTRAAASGESGPLELRGVVFERGEFAFSIYDQASRESKWVTLGQADLPFVARSYDQEQEMLTVEYQGRTTALKLQPAHIAGQAQAGSPSGPAPLPSPEETARQGPGRPQNSAPTYPAANPAQSPPAASPAQSTGPAAPAMKPDESRRLQEMADEIRRRRQQPVQTPRF